MKTIKLITLVKRIHKKENVRIAWLLLANFISLASTAQQKSYIQYVDPFIGTGNYGHNFPGATTPFGMVQLSPDTRIDNTWDGCSGYHYSDSIIYGFSHTHLSGTGASDYGDIMLMPMMGEPSFDNKIYSSNFSHKDEKASAGYYSVKLLDNNIDVELTTATRVGFHKYTFNKEGKAAIVLDLTHRDKLLEGKVKVIDNKTVEGLRRSRKWAKDQWVYFRIQFSKEFSQKQIVAKDTQQVQAAFSFDVKKAETIFVKVSISAVDYDGARKNMEGDLPEWDFEKVKKAAEESWDKELGKIEVTGDDKDKLKIFYTGLYHVMIQPNIYNDVDHRYRGRDNKIHIAEGFDYYTVFSLWDTFRAAHPLYTIIDRKRTVDFIKTFIAQYEQGGRLPVWELSSNETDCMIGYHSVSVIADAAVKGIKNFDMEKALEAMKKSATWNHYGLPAYIDHGFLAMEDEPESVSKTLEYAYDDWCIAQMAQLLEKKDDYNNYIQRGQYWKNLFDAETGFMRPKKNGDWLSPFDPKEVDDNFTEANAWQYVFFVPHDIHTLFNMMGGAEKFDHKLDELFTTENKTTGREQVDITGLIGQYAHGNEPSHHMAYLYNYVGKPWKTQERVHHILTDFYHASPDGLIGNEDCGQMSAWYVMSAMGIYAVTPGMAIYNIGTPLFSNVKIHLENGKIFEIKANNVSGKNYFIQSAKLNKNSYSKVWLNHNEMMKGGKLVFEMGNAKNMNWGMENSDALTPTTSGNEIVLVPLIKSAGKAFRGKTKIALQSVQPNCRLFFTTDGTPPSVSSQEYASPIIISETTTIRAIAVNDKGGKSFVTTGIFHKIPHEWKITINSKYDPQYSARGDEGIIDGLRGDIDWRRGNWQGYKAQDFEAVIDLGKEQDISKLGAGFLQDWNYGIFFPVKVEFELSADGKSFSHTVEIPNSVPDTDKKTQVKDFVRDVPKQKARYVKIKAYSSGRPFYAYTGAKEKSSIFVDEIRIE